MLPSSVRNFLEDNPVKWNLYMKFLGYAFVIVSFVIQNSCDCQITNWLCCLNNDVKNIFNEVINWFWLVILIMIIVNLLIEVFGKVIFLTYIKHIDLKDIDSKSAKFNARLFSLMDFVEIIYRTAYLLVAVYIFISVLGRSQVDLLYVYFILTIIPVCTYFIRKSYHYYLKSFHKSINDSNSRIKEMIKKQK